MSVMLLAGVEGAGYSWKHSSFKLNTECTILLSDSQDNILFTSAGLLSFQRLPNLLMTLINPCLKSSDQVVQ